MLSDIIQSTLLHAFVSHFAKFHVWTVCTNMSPQTAATRPAAKLVCDPRAHNVANLPLIGALQL